MFKDSTMARPSSLELQIYVFGACPSGDGFSQTFEDRREN